MVPGKDSKVTFAGFIDVLGEVIMHTGNVKDPYKGYIFAVYDNIAYILESLCLELLDEAEIIDKGFILNDMIHDAGTGEGFIKCAAPL